jgi:uncharacterized protein YlzI (FlbEa/FlbD family)
MIKLVNGNGFVYVNPDHITDLRICDDGETATKGTTIVRLTNQQWYAVKESPEEIIVLMKRKKNA